MKVNLPTARIPSIDAFRGITIFTMIFVNEVAGVSGTPAWMEHAGADDDAMTFVDVVFPAFLFIVGMSIPFAAARRRKSGSTDVEYAGHTIWRAVSLMIMGIFMVNAEGGYDEGAMGISIYVWSLLFYVALLLIWSHTGTLQRRWVVSLRIAGFVLLLVLALVYRTDDGGMITPRWWGILGLIGWAYLMAFAIYSVTSGRGTVLFILILFLFAYYLFGHHAFPGNILFGHPLLSQGGHATHTAIVLSGVLLSLIFFRIDPLFEQSRRFSQAIWLGTVMVICGFALRPFTPLSKIYATPSWAAFSIASCVVVFIIIYLVTDRLKWNSWTKLVAPAAVNPLLVYIIPFIVYAFMKLVGLSFPDSLYRGVPGIIWAAVYAAIVMALGSVLTRIGLIVRI